MKIVNICATDLDDVAGGGIATWVRELIKSSDSDVEIASIGFTTRGSTLRLGAWNTRMTEEGKEYQFLPLFAARHPAPRGPTIPLNLKLLTALFFTKRSLIPAPATLQIHRVELALPFVLTRRAFPIVLIIHGASQFMELCTQHPLYRRMWFRQCFYWVERFVLSRVARIILVAWEGYEYYLSRYPALKNSFVHIAIGVDTELFKPMNSVEARKRWGFSHADQILLYIGRLVPEKGLDLLIQAFSLLKVERPRSRLLIVGDGDYREKIRDEVRRRNLCGVTFLGPISHAMLPELINCSNALVLPSLFEGFPTVILESLACGTPVVSTAVGDAPRVIKDGATGFLATGCDPHELKEKMLLALDYGCLLYTSDAADE